MSVNAVEISAPHRIDAHESPRGRKSQLIEATIHAIAEHGLSNLTVAKVSSRAGLTGAMVNFHFSNKNALLLATLRYLYAEYEQALEAGSGINEDPVSALGLLVEAYFDRQLSDPARIAVWYAFWGEVRARADYMEVCGARDDALSERMLALCRQIIERDGYDLDAAAIAGGLSGLLEESWQCFLVDDGASVRAERLGLCRAYLSSVFPRSFVRDARAEGSPSASRGAQATRGTPDQQPDWDRRMLPPWVYRSSEFTELEKEKVFRRRWLMVGHESEIPSTGDYLSFDAVDERALIVRGQKGRLRAFHNVCRHRASRVVSQPRGTCKRAITCPFHGWTYGLDGKLKGVPSAETFGDLARSKLGLKSLDLEVWQGFLFIRFGGDGPSAADMFEPHAAELEPYRLADLQPYGSYWERELPVDWKVVHDVDNEGYHVPVAHPGLQRLVGDSYYDEVMSNGVSRSFSTLVDSISPRWSEAHYQRLLPSVEHLPESHRRAWLYYGFFPNLSIAFYPDMVDFFQAFPISPNRCLIRGRAYALKDDRPAMRAARYLNGRINERVGAEDNDLMMWSAAGMQTSGFDRAILSDKEKGVRWMHDQMREAIPVAGQQTPPVPGTVAERNRQLGG